MDAKKILETNIISALKSIYDPEIPVDIYELGLIYDIGIDDEKNIKVLMTLTSPNCPVAESLPVEVEDKVKLVPGVKTADVKIVFEPAWEHSMMSEEAKFELGML